MTREVRGQGWGIAAGVDALGKIFADRFSFSSHK